MPGRVHEGGWFALLEKVGPLMPTITGIFTGIGSVVADVVSIIASVVRQTFTVIGQFWAEWGGPITSSLSATFSGIVNMIAAAVDVIKGVIHAVMQAIHGDWSGAWDGIKQILSGVWDAMSAYIDGVLATITGIPEHRLRFPSDKAWNLGIDRGPAMPASRHSRKGVLHWQITVREDGYRLFEGCLPTLIQWGKPDDAEPLRLHPRNSLPRSRVSLDSIAVSHPSAAKLQAAYDAVGLEGISVNEGPANLVATLQTPKGLVQLQSLGI